MNTKLTLSIEKKVIEKAKHYAKKSKRSLSEIIQSYLEAITTDQNDFSDDELKSIKGAITLPDNFDLKKEIRLLASEKFST
ncbi:MAG: ribosome recycling factor [Saprospiraceae bacterium]|jgi:ribosome recycling factor